MATIYPPRFRGEHESERPAYEAFSRLSDPWRVFHGVHWLSPGRPPRDGEADFVLLHPEHGLYVLENKGGDVLVEGGVWYRRTRNGLDPIPKDPFEQATSSKHVLLRFLGDRARIGHIKAGHGVIVPDIVVDGDLGPAASREVIFDKRDLSEPQQSVDRLVAFWEGRGDHLTQGAMDRITSLIAPTLEIRPLLREAVDEARNRLIQLTEEQVRLLDLLNGTRRVIAYGGAGTGKTVLAVEQARRLARLGFAADQPILLLCFNRPLGDHLKEILHGEDAIVTGSFQSFCWHLAKRAGQPLPRDPNQRWFDEELPALAAEVADATGFRASAVVVDEGQDFHRDWWDYLRLMFAAEDTPFYVFADPHQAIFRKGWEPPFQEPNFQLTVNCRNTVQIAEQVAAVFGDSPATLGIDGPDVETISARDDKEIAKALRSSLHRLLVDENLEASQIVVLADRKNLVDRLRGTEFANQRLVEPGKRGVVVESIHRFKGLESDSVILIQTTQPDDDGRMLAYVGMSRARAHLVVIGPGG